MNRRLKDLEDQDIF